MSNDIKKAKAASDGAAFAFYGKVWPNAFIFYFCASQKS
jgi:hypothetical protein